MTMTSLTSLNTITSDILTQATSIRNEKDKTIHNQASVATGCQDAYVATPLLLPVGSHATTHLLR